MTTRKTSQATVTESAAQAVLRRGAARRLAADEEKVMRMRLGAALPRSAEIEWVGTADEELAIELRAMEIEAYLQIKARQAPRAAVARAPATARTTTSRAKDKIVRALRRKGPVR